MELIEKINVSAVNKIIKSGCTDNRALQFCYAMSHMPIKINEDGVQYYESPCTYRYGNGMTFGRQYAHPSLQSCPGYVRRLTSHQFYKDIDMKNAFPSILEQICLKNGVFCRHLSNYVLNRENIISSMMKNNQTLSYNNVKNIFLICMHNGFNFEKKKIHDFQNETINKFKKEMTDIAKTLFELDCYRSIKSKLDQKKGKTNKYGTFISWLCQPIENSLILAAREFFESIHMTVGVLVFDGLMVEGADDVFTQDLLTRLSEFCYKKTGYKIEFVKKTMTPSEKDEDRIRVFGEKEIVKKNKKKDVIVIDEDPVESRDDKLYTRRVRRIDFGGDIFNSEKRCIAINASMNMGKSYQSKQFLRREFKKNPNLRVGVICCRIQQGNTIIGQLKEFDFELYNDETTNISKANKLVIQYESLFKLGMNDDNFEPFDVLLIDEYRGVCNQITSPTNKSMMIQNFQNFKFLHLSSKKVLLLDAYLFIDPLCKDLLDSLFKPTEIAYHLYTHISLKRKFRLQSKSQLMDSVKKFLLNKERVALVFRSKKQMSIVIESLKSSISITDANILQFSSSTPTRPSYNNNDEQGTNMQIFQNIDKFLNENPQIQLMCFTSKVTVGADIQTSFDRVFLHGISHQGPCVRDCFQMIGRFRNVIDPVVRVLLPKPKSDLEGTSAISYEKEMARLRSRKNIATVLNDLYLKSDKELVQGRVQWSTTDMMKVAGRVSTEHRKDFSSEFYRMCKLQKYQVSVCDTIVETIEVANIAKSLKTSTDSVDKRTLTHEKKAYDVIRLIDNLDSIQSEINELSRLSKQGQLTDELKFKLQFLKMTKYFPGTYTEMEFDELKFATNNKLKLIAAKWIKEDSQISRRSQDLYRMFNSCGMPEEAVLMQKSFENISNAILLVNSDFKNASNEKFDGQDVLIVANQMENLLDASCLARNGRDQTTKKEPVQRVLSKLRRELDAHGYYLENERVGPRTDRKRLYRVSIQPKIDKLLERFVLNTEKEFFSGGVEINNLGSGYDENPKKRKKDCLVRRIIKKKKPNRPSPPDDVAKIKMYNKTRSAVGFPLLPVQHKIEF